MPLVVNTVCRYNFNGTYMGRPWANILDMRIDTTGTAVERPDWIYDTAGHLLNAWADHLASNLVDECVLTDVSWVDLNSAAGSTGTRSSTAEHTAPIPGSATQDPSPSNVAVLVRKQVVAQRGRRNGRWYQTGISEAASNGSDVRPESLPVYQSSWDDFLAEVNDEGLVPGGPTREAVVVHTTGENPQTGTYSVIESFVVEQRLATQRRRLRA